MVVTLALLLLGSTTEAKKLKFKGVAAVGRLMVTFTLLTNLEDAPERAQALDVVRSARHVLPEP